jgi:PAS domain-containing protein
MEKQLWTGSYYLNYFEPETRRKSELVFGYQLDGEWITRHHGLASALPEERVKRTLETIKRCNVAVTKYGAVNYARPDGTPGGLIGTVIDITQRKRAEDELQQIKKFSEGIIQTMTEGLVLTDSEGKFTFVNPAAAGM